MANKIFSNSEKKVISAMYQLDRWATTNEISDWANMSWNTVNDVMNTLWRKKIVKRKKFKEDKRVYWIIVE